MEEGGVVVMDRSLMLGELVTRAAADGKTLGIVLDVSVQADLALLPPTKEGPTHVLCGKSLHAMQFANVTPHFPSPIPLNAMFPMQPFDASSNSNYIFYNDWVGALTEVRERLLLRAERGYK